VDGIGWGGPVGGMNDRQNPVRLLEYNKDNGYRYQRFFGNVYAELVKNLTLKSSFGVDFPTIIKECCKEAMCLVILKIIKRCKHRPVRY
jgi:hypothetical protein